jgi:fibronectin-binding autotransporter adhesin
VEVDNATLNFTDLLPPDSTLNQNVTLGSGIATIQATNGSIAFTGTISGPGQLNLQYNYYLSSPAIDYAFSGVNSYSGGTVIGSASVGVTGTSQSLGTGGVTLENGAVLTLNAESNLAPGQTVAMQSGSVLVVSSSSINLVNLIGTNPAETTGGTIALTGTRCGTALNMSAIGNGQLFLGSSDTNVIYTATSLGVGAGGVYRLGGGSTTLTSSPKLTLASGPNLLTGSNSVIIGNGTSGNSEAYANTIVAIDEANHERPVISPTTEVGYDSHVEIYPDRFL